MSSSVFAKKSLGNGNGSSCLTKAPILAIPKVAMASSLKPLRMVSKVLKTSCWSIVN